jgi:hypothetical protein
MLAKSDFAPDEWQTLFTAAPMVSLGVSAASPSGPFGVLKEMFSVGMAVADVLKTGSDNALVKVLVKDMQARGTKPEAPKGVKTPEDAKKAVLDHMGRVSDILARKAPTEADGFKRWLVDIANRVAQASNEGGFLGLGGEKVSAAEQAEIRAIADRLGVPGSR